MSDNCKENINRIAQYIASGCKRVKSKKIGVECEHFITDMSGKAVPFWGERGIETILKELSHFYPNVSYSDDRVIGLNDEKLYITLEPAAQIETSLIPLASIGKIEELYSSFRKRLNNIISKYSYNLVSKGYQPISRADELSLIPKKRYFLMDEYFKNIGTRAVYMMRGSASVQANIDYFSEDDFIKKYRLANILSPLFYLITDNASIFEGERYNGFSARSMIWQNVDNKRCEMPCEIFDRGVGFEEYAKWVYSVPPIFIEENGAAISTGSKTSNMIFDDCKINEEQIKHILSMVFPDVRAKQFIEIRSGDSMPQKYMLSYASLVKGLFYNDDAIKKLDKLFENVRYSDIAKVKKDIQKNGFSADYFGTSLNEIVKIVFSYAYEGLKNEEKDYLLLLRDSAEKSKTVREALLLKEAFV